MRRHIDNVVQRVDALTLRERALIFATLMIIVVASWYAALMQPLANREQAVQAELETVRKRLETLNGSMQAAAVRLGADPHSDTRVLIARIRAQLEQLDAELQMFTADLIAPAEMAYVLEDVLRRQNKLRLLGVRHLGAEPLTAGPEDSGDAADLYKHSVELELEGRYLDCLAYVRELEALPWRFFWERFELEVETFPRNRIRILVHTLSLEEEWIGV